MNYHEMDDTQLWDLILNGDSEAFKLIYYRNYELLLNYGFKLCQNEELVKDCIHDVFLKIFGNKKLSRSDQIRPYLLRSTRNMITEEMGKKGVANIVEFDMKSTFALELISTDNNDGQDDEELRKSNILANSLMKLTNNQKRILYLRYVRELSFKEIAEFLDINVQSAMNLASRTMTKLRNILRNYN